MQQDPGNGAANAATQEEAGNAAEATQEVQNGSPATENGNGELKD